MGLTLYCQYTWDARVNLRYKAVLVLNWYWQLTRVKGTPSYCQYQYSFVSPTGRQFASVYCYCVSCAAPALKKNNKVLAKKCTRIAHRTAQNTQQHYPVPCFEMSSTHFCHCKLFRRKTGTRPVAKAAVARVAVVRAAVVRAVARAPRASKPARVTVPAG